ncbi:hypothetical protein [Rugamonas rubra]|uniref:hypothetical protein n=1 Tax=Rugamonas rubra TaxID=758825 RepID=UPI001C2D3EE7|nr:hypothetical protein [Rugamonas rubra]
MDEMIEHGTADAAMLNRSAGFLLNPFDLPGVAILVSSGAVSPASGARPRWAPASASRCAAWPTCCWPEAAPADCCTAQEVALRRRAPLAYNVRRGKYTDRTPTSFAIRIPCKKCPRPL